ncbi:hypothetical protein D9757_005233 [Collybiopsis confluens]|uniref:Uncharacterized protein n=1 Tax=Collybiopsis confluens TaxID=2823264 RepID=A0A8H5HVN0_9AGAR|nr:hypothetical protein D9757_005233 [Collybiopsis confluens]
MAMHRALVLASVACLAAVVSCLPSGHGSFRVVSVRQDNSNIPSQCQSVCDPVIDPIDADTCTPSACCNNKFVGNLASCFECVGNLTGTSDYTMSQTIVDGKSHLKSKFEKSVKTSLVILVEFVSSCALEGFNISDPTLPGQSSSRSLSSLPTSSAPHASGSGSSSSTMHQSTVTAITFSSIPFPQTTVTSLPTTISSNPASTSASTSATGGNSNANGSPQALGWSRTMICGFIGAVAVGFVV